MINIDPNEDGRGSLSSITFTDAYGSTSDRGLSPHGKKSKGNAHVALAGDDSDSDDEEQVKRYQLSHANEGVNSRGLNVVNENGPSLPPRPSRPGGDAQQQQQKRRHRGKHRKRQDKSSAANPNEKHGKNIEITFPDEKDGILAPGNSVDEPFIEQGDLDCAYMCTCLLLLLILPTLVYFFTNMSESWRLHTGASRHVVLSSTFTKSVSIQRTPPTQEHGHEHEVDTGGIFTAYHLDGKCPPLTGPKLTLDHKRSLHLDGGSYDWNRYYLNPGSILNVKVTANSGGIKLFLFRGKTAFESWRHDPSEYNSFFWRNHTYEGFDPAIIVHEAVIAEAFYVVYSNAFRWGADLSIEVERTLTTFDLTGVEPIPKEDCNHDGTECTIYLSPWRLACIVVMAESPRPFKNGTSAVVHSSYTVEYAEHAEQGGHATDDAVVYVDVDGHHRWTSVITLVVVPALLLLLVADRGVAKDDEDDDNDGDDGELTAILEQQKKKAATRPAPNGAGAVLASEETPLVVPGSPVAVNLATLQQHVF